MKNDNLNDWNVVEKNGKVMVWQDLSNDVDVNAMKDYLNETPKVCTNTNSVVFLVDKLDFRKEANYSELELISRYVEPTSEYSLV